MSAKHKDPNFVRAGQRIRRWANLHPDTRCWRCGRTLLTCGPHHNGTNRNGTPAWWEAGHTNHGTLAAECSPCNRSHGAADGNRMREPASGWFF